MFIPLWRKHDYRIEMESETNNNIQKGRFESENPMNDFGPKRPMSEDAPCASEGVEKAKRGRPKKKPDYDRDKEIEAFQARAVELFGEPYDDRIERSKDAPSIRDVAAAMDTTPLRVRKMLVTAGVYSTRLSREVQKLYEEG